MSLYFFLFVINIVFGSLAVYLLYLANSSSNKSLFPPQMNSSSNQSLSSSQIHTKKEIVKINQNILGDGFMYDENLYDEYGNLKKGITLKVKFRNDDLKDNIEHNSNENNDEWDIIDPWEFKKKKKLNIYSSSPNMSSGEREVMKALKFYKIQFEAEYMLPRYRYRWDFYCPEFNLFIEYDGQQHFFPKSFGEETEEKTLENFQKRQLADKHKDKIVKELGGYTLRIPYNKKDETGILIKEKIQKIKAET